MADKPSGYMPLGTPLFLKETEALAKLWRRELIDSLEKVMQISATKAAEVQKLYEAWSSESKAQTPAIDAFRGDIYSGLQVPTWSVEDRAYAHEHLIILSGLYGALRACDGIVPYRLEMGYKLPGGKSSMYSFWGDMLVRAIAPQTTCLINLSAVEYTKALLPYVNQPVVTPKFMTMNQKTGEPAFVTVHAKIARGAFARWMVQRRIEDMARLRQFNDIGYHYDEQMSTPEQPVFVCEEFQGIGLSVRI